RLRRRRNYDPIAGADSREPAEQFLWVADRGGEPHALELATGVPAHALEHSEQVPTAIVACKGMKLVDDHRAYIREERRAIDAARDEHDHDRLRGREENIRRVRANPPALPLSHVPVPALDPAPDQRAVARKPRLEVVEQRSDRADVQHGEALPSLGEHAGE